MWRHWRSCVSRSFWVDKCLNTSANTSLCPRDTFILTLIEIIWLRHDLCKRHNLGFYIQHTVTMYFWHRTNVFMDLDNFNTSTTTIDNNNKLRHNICVCVCVWSEIWKSQKVTSELPVVLKIFTWKHKNCFVSSWEHGTQRDRFPVRNLI